jgi:hypothetical protein
MFSRAQNKRQKERGVDRTYKVVGRVPYRSLYAANQQHMDLLLAELVYRGMGGEQAASLGYRMRVASLKELEKDKKSFRAKTPVNFSL